MKKQRHLHLLFLLFTTAFAAGTARAAAPGTVVVWENNVDGSTNVSHGLTNVTAIAAGPAYTVALRSDGSVVAWGGLTWNGETNVPPGLSNVTAIATGEFHTMALRSDGTVVAWGTYAWSGERTTVPAGLSGVTAISAGFSHSVALKSDGTVVAWGDNGFGQTNVPSGLSNVTAIAAGLHSTVALKSDGTVMVWGWSGLPDGGLTNVMAIASSSGHTLALKRDGTVVAWGYNDSGQTSVPPGLTNVTAISAGGGCPFDCEGSSVALRNDGTVVAWGSSPDVPAGLTNVIAIAAGLYHTVAIVGYPPPVPTLEASAMGHELILSWSTNAVGFALQSTPDINPPAIWIDSTSAAAVVGGQFTVTNTFSGNAQFYRLKKL